MARLAFSRAPGPLDSLISEAKRAAVDRALAAAFPGSVVETAEQMAWGVSGAGVFKLVVSGVSCVLRVEGPPNPLRDPVRHYTCMQIAAEAGIAPRLLFADATDEVSLTAFIDAVAIDRAMVGEDGLVAIAKAVRRLHAAPLFPTLVPYLDALDVIMGQFRQSGLFSAETLAAPTELYARLCAAYPRNDPHLVSSHNDLNPSNVIFANGRAWIVDWETGFAADPYADIAALANWFVADEASEALILAVYFGAPPSEAQMARFLVMRQINRLFFGAMLIGSAVASQPVTRLPENALTGERFSDIRSEMAALATVEGRLRFGCAFIGEALHDAVGSRFEAALQKMRLIACRKGRD